MGSAFAGIGLVVRCRWIVSSDATSCQCAANNSRSVISKVSLTVD